MSVPPKALRLTRDDLPPGTPEWTEQLLGSSTPFQEATSKALDRALTFGQNIQSQLVTLEVQAPQPAWTGINAQGNPTPAYARGWVQYADAAYPDVGFRIDSTGRVWLRGIISSGTATAGIMFTVPASYLPARDCIFTTVSNDLFGAGVVRVGTSSVNFVAGSNTYYCLDGVSWQAGPACAAELLPVGARWPLIIKVTIPTVSWVQVVRVEDLSAPFGALTGFGVVGVPEWTFDSTGGLVIRSVPGLTPGRQYRLTFLALAG